MNFEYFKLLKGKHRRMRKIIILYIIFLHVFVVITIVKTDILSRIQAKIGLVENEENYLTYYYQTMVAFHKRLDKNIPINSVIFIGDSLIQGLAVTAIFPKSINFGIGQDTTEGALARIPYYSSISRSKLVVVAIGVNDLWERDDEEIVNNYLKIIDLIPTKIPILFSAIMPINELASKKSNYNYRISSLNARIKKICSNNPRLNFLDISSDLIDLSGNLSEQYHNGDGIHLNGLGNSIWISNLKEIISEITSKYNNDLIK